MNNLKIVMWHPWWSAEGNLRPSLARWLLLGDSPLFLQILRVVRWLESAVLSLFSSIGMLDSTRYRQSSHCPQGLDGCCYPLHVCWLQVHRHVGDEDVRDLPLWTQLWGCRFVPSLGRALLVGRSKPFVSKSCMPSWKSWKPRCPI